MLDPHENQSQIMLDNEWDSILMFSLVFSKFLAMRNITLYSVSHVTCYEFNPLIGWNYIIYAGNQIFF